MSEVDDYVYRVLTIPLAEGKRASKVHFDGAFLQTGQAYRGSRDYDMSDIAVAFYDVFYADILTEPVLRDGRFANRLFAGDTMNTFATTANRSGLIGSARRNWTPEAEWPEWLRKYRRNGRCLANFWLVPCEIGRSFIGPLNFLNKMRYARDYMDRFLELVKSADFTLPYFSCFGSWDGFVERHCLGCYLNGASEVLHFSSSTDAQTIFDEMHWRIRQRAADIASCDRAPALHERFAALGITI